MNCALLCLSELDSVAMAALLGREGLDVVPIPAMDDPPVVLAIARRAARDFDFVALGKRGIDHESLAHFFDPGQLITFEALEGLPAHACAAASYLRPGQGARAGPRA